MATWTRVRQSRAVPGDVGPATPKEDEVMNHNRFRLIAPTLLAVLCAVHPALAAPGSPRLVIVSVTADVAAETVTIDGTGFGDGEPVVTFNGTPLTVLTATPNHIEATLPAGLAPGGYLLTVSRGPATTQFDAFNVTLGAAGPQGPTGPTGPPGPQGAAGTFTGHFQSPNGQYSLDVADSGIRLAGPGATMLIGTGTVTIMATNVVVRSDVSTEIRSGATTMVRSGTNTDIQSSASTTVNSGATTTVHSAATTSIEGALVLLNGGGRPAARAGDGVQVDPGSGSGVITAGSATVLVGN
jgi:IPT/TIG domain-containing protein